MGEAEGLVDEGGASVGQSVEEHREYESAYDVDDVVHLGHEQHVHHVDQREEGQYGWPFQTQLHHLQEDDCQASRVAGVEEVTGVVVRHCQREESRAAPSHVFRVRKLRHVLLRKGNTKKMMPRVR